MNNSNVVIEAADLVIGYRHGRKKVTEVAADIDLTLRSGELVCLLGPNGAGKSTLIRSLTGVQPVLNGAIALNGRPLKEYHPAELAREIAVVLTEKIEVGMLSVYALVALGRYPYTSWVGDLSPNDERVIRWALTAVGAADLAARQVNELSDGERQKVMIARALAQEPRLIVLDEPTAYLDLPHRVEIIRILRNLAREENRAILISTHDLDLALRSADRLWLLPANGKMKMGAPEDLVLNGAFQETFFAQGIEFDAARGSFRINRLSVGEIDLIGDGLVAQWTGRALEREGYDVTWGLNGSPVKIEVLSGGDQMRREQIWNLTFGSQTRQVASVSTLIAELRKLQD